MTLDAGHLRREAELRIEKLWQNTLTNEDRRRAAHVAKLIRQSLACRLRAATALARFEQARARLCELMDRRPDHQ